MISEGLVVPPRSPCKGMMHPNKGDTGPGSCKKINFRTLKSGKSGDIKENELKMGLGAAGRGVVHELGFAIPCKMEWFSRPQLAWRVVFDQNQCFRQHLELLMSLRHGRRRSHGPRSTATRPELIGPELLTSRMHENNSHHYEYVFRIAMGSASSMEFQIFMFFYGSGT